MEPPTASNPCDRVGEEALSFGRPLRAISSCHTLAVSLRLTLPLCRASQEVARVPGFLLALSCWALCSGKGWKARCAGQCLLLAAEGTAHLSRSAFSCAVWTCAVFGRSAWAWCWLLLFPCEIATSLQRWRTAVRRGSVLSSLFNAHGAVCGAVVATVVSAGFIWLIWYSGINDQDPNVVLLWLNLKAQISVQVMWCYVPNVFIDRLSLPVGYKRRKKRVGKLKGGSERLNCLIATCRGQKFKSDLLTPASKTALALVNDRGTWRSLPDNPDHMETASFPTAQGSQAGSVGWPEWARSPAEQRTVVTCTLLRDTAPTSSVLMQPEAFCCCWPSSALDCFVTRISQGGLQWLWHHLGRWSWLRKHPPTCLNNASVSVHSAVALLPTCSSPGGLRFWCYPSSLPNSLTG